MALLGVCNPLLDVVAEVPHSILDEYDLPHGGAVLANDKQMGLFPRLETEYTCKYMAGGCGQNTIRVYQALCKKASHFISHAEAAQGAVVFPESPAAQQGYPTRCCNWPAPIVVCISLVCGGMFLWRSLEPASSLGALGKIRKGNSSKSCWRNRVSSREPL